MTMEPILIMEPNYTATADRNTGRGWANIAGFLRAAQ